MTNFFRKFAIRLEDVYGVQFDREEGFVVCPECEEPLYDCDWDKSDFINEDCNFVCPICGEPLEII